MATSWGDPEDGDLVDEPAKVRVPEEVSDAVRTLIRWAGDDPGPRRLLDTPARVARAWKEYARGYAEDPAHHLSRTFEEVGGYDEIVLLKDIPFQSHASIIWPRSSARRRSPICRGTAWSAFPSSPGCCTVLRGGCRCRNG